MDVSRLKGKELGKLVKAMKASARKGCASGALKKARRESAELRKQIGIVNQIGKENPAV